MELVCSPLEEQLLKKREITLNQHGFEENSNLRYVEDNSNHYETFILDNLIKMMDEDFIYNINNQIE